MTSYLPHSDYVSNIIIDFERLFPEYHHAKFGTKNKLKTEEAQYVTKIPLPE